MSDPRGVERERAAADLLAGHGVPGARVRSEGHQGEMAVLTSARDRWREMTEVDRRALVASIKALGYRYVALDLEPTGDGGA